MVQFQLVIKTGQEQTNGIVRTAYNREDMLEIAALTLAPLSKGLPVQFQIDIPEEQGAAWIVLFPQIMDKCTVAILELPPEPDSFSE